MSRDATVMITVKLLRQLGAICDQVGRFEQFLGRRHGCRVTSKNLAAAHAAGLDVAWVAGNPSTPPAALTALATDADVWVRRQTAGNPSTPGSALTALATDLDAGVRWRIASNPSTSLAALATLAVDPDAEVRWRIASNPSTPGSASK